MDEKPSATDLDLSRQISRLLIAAVTCPAILFVGRWCGSHCSAFFDGEPTAPLTLLYLCPIYVMVASIAFAWRSRLMFTATSLAVWWLAPAGSSTTMTWVWRNAVYAAKDIQLAGLLVVAICFAILICTRYLEAKQRTRISIIQLLGGIAFTVVLTWLTVIATIAE